MLGVDNGRREIELHTKFLEGDGNRWDAVAR